MKDVLIVLVYGNRTVNVHGELEWDSGTKVSEQLVTNTSTMRLPEIAIGDVARRMYKNMLHDEEQPK